MVIDLATPEGCKAEFDGGVETKTVQSVIIITLSAIVGGVAQWYNVGLWPANFPCPALDLQLMGDH